jgi:endonuclease III
VEESAVDLATKAQAIHTTLLATFGEPRWQPGNDPLEVLIGTILSANTNDTNSGRALDQLKTTFGNDWEAVRTAPLEAVKAAIRPAGMYNQKAPNLVATLTRLQQDRGNYDLAFLAELPVVEALAYLTSLPGVGHKTASIVLLFCFNLGAFPVDTHVQRISQRLGISGRRASPEQIKARWEQLLPPTTYYPLHLNLIRHGREICQARTPRCERCPLQQFCDYFQQTGEWQP